MDRGFPSLRKMGGACAHGHPARDYRPVNSCPQQNTRIRAEIAMYGAARLLLRCMLLVIVLVSGAPSATCQEINVAILLPLSGALSGWSNLGARKPEDLVKEPFRKASPNVRIAVYDTQGLPEN